MGRIRDVPDRHRGLVVPLYQQPLTVGGPPEAVRPAQLLGRDELGQPPDHFVRLARVRTDQQPRSHRRRARPRVPPRSPAKATRRPVGSKRGSTTATWVVSSRTGASPTRSTTNSRDDNANTAVVTASSVLNAVIPAVCTLARSRRARSSPVRASSDSASSSTGSQSRRSVPLGTSQTQSPSSRVVPDSDLTNTTRSPSGLTTSSRGSPRLKFNVRAARRGKESTTTARS